MDAEGDFAVSAQLVSSGRRKVKMSILRLCLEAEACEACEAEIS